MAYLSVNNVRYAGTAVCVPQNVEDNLNYPWLTPEERQVYVESTGVRYRHCTSPDVCTSDLCFKAAEKLLSDLGWDKSEIDALVFVSATPDYKMPATACVLQERLGLPNTCLAFDISLGCSGFVYGLSVLAGMMEKGEIQKALLLVGNTQFKNSNPRDKSAYLILGDAGTASALVYDAQAAPMYFSLQTFGDGKDSLIIPDGGYRNPITPESFVEKADANGNIRTALQFKMDGEAVFQFVMMRVVGCIKDFMSHFEIIDDKVDYYMLHHASKISCNKIHKKLKLADDKVPYNFYNYGNTSNACVPLLMVTNIADTLKNKDNNLIITGFGTGLSFGAGYLNCDHIVVSELQYL